MDQHVLENTAARPQFVGNTNNNDDDNKLIRNKLLLNNAGLWITMIKHKTITNDARQLNNNANIQDC